MIFYSLALGYADQAQQQSQQALVLARQTEHTLSLLFAEIWVALLSQCRRDVVATRAHADAAIALATAQGLALRFEQGRLLRGWAVAMQGDAATGVAHIRQGMAAYQGIGGPQLLYPYWCSLLAKASGQAGQPAAGLQAVDEAFVLMAATEERWWEAELYRLRGELLLQLPFPEISQAVACFQQALDVARGQQAKALELRTALSLSRLWQLQGKRGQARQALTEVYSWFTEGFDTADLQEARALLEALT